MDNRPLRFDEFDEKVNQVVFMSATPSPYELEISTRVVEQIVRPTGLVDPEVIVRPTKGQIDDLVAEINARAEKDQRVLVTTLTKKMSEDLTDYLLELGIRVRYLHSEVDTLERVEILRSLRLGEFDVLVGINLLREGLDLPGGRAGRDPRRRQGRLPAVRDVADPDDRTGGAQRRRSGGDVRRPGHRFDAPRDQRDEPPAQAAARIQRGARHRPADDPQEGHRHPGDGAAARHRRQPRHRWPGSGRSKRSSAIFGVDLAGVAPDELDRLIQTLQEEMHEAAKDLRFEEAARLRDEINELKRELKAAG